MDQKTQEAKERRAERKAMELQRQQDLEDEGLRMMVGAGMDPVLAMKWVQAVHHPSEEGLELLKSIGKAPAKLDQIMDVLCRNGRVGASDYVPVHYLDLMALVRAASYTSDAIKRVNEALEKRDQAIKRRMMSSAVQDKSDDSPS